MNKAQSLRWFTRFSGIAASLLLVACGPSSTAMESAQTAQDAVQDMAKPDIVDTAVSAGQFQTLVAAVQAAGLVETLKGPGPFTVFAPTDEAFARLPEGTVANLLLPENRDQLAAILTYHVVPDAVRAEQVVALNSVGTVQGASLPILTDAGGVQIGDARVLQTDIECANGVIHVIDSVLIP